MKLIGVTGKTGSGKTTFSNQFEKRKNVEIIHVDDLVGSVKEKYLGFLIRPKEEQDKKPHTNTKNCNTSSGNNNPLFKSGIKNVFYKNKFLFKIWMACRNKLIEKSLNKKIEEYKSDGKKIVIIDDWNINSIKSLKGKLSHTYIIDRPYINRRNGIRNRDNLSLDDINVADMPYALGFVKLSDGDNVTRIINNDSIGALSRIADREYERFGELTFDERYCVKFNTPQEVLRAIERIPSTTQVTSKNAQKTKT